MAALSHWMIVFFMIILYTRITFSDYRMKKVLWVWTKLVSSPERFKIKSFLSREYFSMKLMLLLAPHFLHLTGPLWHVSVSGTRRFLCVWWATSRTCVTPGRCERTRAAAWLRRTAVTSRRFQQPRATRTLPTSSPSSSGRWWSTSSTEQTDDGTAAPSLWPSSSTMCLAREGSQCDSSSEVNSYSAGMAGMLCLDPY